MPKEVVPTLVTRRSVPTVAAAHQDTYSEQITTPVLVSGPLIYCSSERQFEMLIWSRSLLSCYRQSRV